TTAAPNAARLNAAAGCTPLRRSTRAGTVSAAHIAIGRATGRASFGDMISLRTDAPPGPKDRGHPGQATSSPKVSPTLDWALPPEGRGALRMSTTGRRATPLQTL